MTTKIHPITRAMMFAQFLNAVANRIAVTKIPSLQAFEANQDPGFRLFVAKRLEPVGERFLCIVSLVSENFNHGDTVTYKLQHGKGYD